MLEEAHVRALAQQLLSALSHMHERSVHHLHVTARNVRRVMTPGQSTPTYQLTGMVPVALGEQAAQGRAQVFTSSAMSCAPLG